MLTKNQIFVSLAIFIFLNSLSYFGFSFLIGSLNIGNWSMGFKIIYLILIICVIVPLSIFGALDSKRDE